MDPVKIEKLQAMRRYRSLRYRFTVNLVQYCLTLVGFGLFLSCPLWLPKLFAAVRYLFFVFVPGTGTYLFSPRCFFVLGNVIVVFLVGESKLSAAAAPSTPDIYDEYVERSKGGRRRGPLRPHESHEKEKDAEVRRPAIDSGFGRRQDVYMAVKPREEAEVEEDDDGVDDGGDGYGGDGGGSEECWENMESTSYEGENDQEELPDEEFKRRVDDFIAKFNHQRRLELLGGGMYVQS